MKNEIKCPCCGIGTVTDEYDICLVCGWENDPIQNADPDFSGGANKESMNSHRANFLKHKEKNSNYLWCNTWKK